MEESKVCDERFFNQMVKKIVDGKLQRWSSDEYEGKAKFYTEEGKREIARIQAVDFLVLNGWAIGSPEEIAKAREEYNINKLKENLDGNAAIILKIVEGLN